MKNYPLRLPLFSGRLNWLLLALLVGLGACVDPLDLTIRGTVDVVVVDGTITNLPEPQIIRLSRSKSDSLTGRPGSLAITKAIVEVIVDSTRIITAQETSVGSYQLPSDFRGQTGHAYQLRFTLSNGTTYLSTQQIMPSVPAINQVTARFNPTGLPATELNGFTAAHDIYINTQDPAPQANYYRWDWKLWEAEEYCRTCIQGQYSVNNVQVLISANGLQYYQTGDSLFEDCFYPPPPTDSRPLLPFFVYDYPCRTQCWSIFYSHELNAFADSYSNGGQIIGRKVAQIPFYQHRGCLVEIRQSGLTPTAYQFFKNLQDQTQNTGGVADTPPTATVSNVRNIANKREIIVGFFTATAVSTSRYWLDRKDTQGVIPPGLFEALMGREPIREPSPPAAIPFIYIITTIADKPPYTAVCSPTDAQTPVKPVGWQD